MIRVMVVDDHPGVRRSYVLLFEHAPNMVVVGEAADGEAAIDAFDRLRPDVTVLDLSLPTISGWEVLARIRAMEADARVLIVSVCGDERDFRRARDAGARAYLLKECAADDVLDAVRTMAPQHDGPQKMRSASIPE